MNDGTALLAAILAFPEEDTPRLVYADWLEENGQEERAEFIRVQCELAANASEAGLHQGNPFEQQPVPCQACIYYGRLRTRQRELWASLSQAWVNSCDPLVVLHLGDVETQLSLSGTVRRGFVASITCTAADWLAHGDAITAAHPVTRVALTTWPGCAANESRGGWRLCGESILSGPFTPWRVLPGRPANGLDGRGAVRDLLKIEWPGITFELPA